MSSSLLQPTLFLLIPLFSIALIVLALSHSPGPPKPQAILAYTYIASVTLLSTLAGALSLSHSSSSLSEPLIQAHIPSRHSRTSPPTRICTTLIHPNTPYLYSRNNSSIFVAHIATLLALISPFLPTVTPLLYIPPSLFLLYTIQAIPRIAYILHNFLYPEENIQIPIQFHPTTPISPASTTSFPFSTDEIRKHHHKIPSVSTTSTITIVDRARISFPPRPRQQEQHQHQEPSDQLRSQILNSRSRSLLVFILAVQIAALAANACALGVTIATNNNTLKTVQTACTVLAVTGSMSAYLLHTYNLHLRQTPTPTPTISNPNYNNLSTHSSDQLQMLESQQHHSNPHSPMLIQLAPPPPSKARRKRANAGVSMEKNLFTRNDETNAKVVTTIDSDLEELELELDVVMDIGRYPMTLGRGLGLGAGTATATTGLGSSKKRTVVQDSIGLATMSSPAYTPVPPALPVSMPLKVSVEEGSGCAGVSALGNKEKQKEKIQGYYLSSSSSTSTGSPSSPFSPFERCGMETETDPSSPDTPYPNSYPHLNTSGGSPDASSGAINANANTHKLVRKRSSFFGWEFAWDQEALERADDAGKLRSAGSGGGGGGSPVRWKSDVNMNAKLKEYGTLNPSTCNHTSTSKKIQPLLIVDNEESFMDLGGDQESSPPLSRPPSLSSEVGVEGGRMKRGMSWRSSVCGVVGVGGEKVKRKNTLLGVKPLRLSRSFGGSNNSDGSGGRGSGNGNGNGNGGGMGHRTILSGDVGPMCGLSLKRRATALIGGQRSPVSPVSGSTMSSRAIGQENGDATRTTTRTIAASMPTAPKRLKKTKPRHSTAAVADATGISPSAESEVVERSSKNNIDNHSIDTRNLDSDGDELDEDAELQKTPTMKSRTTTRSYSHSPRSYHSSSPNQQQQQHHEVAATSESHCSSINESCITITTTTATITTTTTANTNSPSKLSPSLTRRGLSLKRSFKMGSTVGRTLGPGLTLSSAGLSSIPGVDSNSGPDLASTSTSTSAWHCAHKSIRRYESEGFEFREEDEKRGCEEKEKRREEKKGKETLDDGKKKVAKEDDEDVDVEAEMRSVVAARVVSASYARATPAAAILTPATRAGVGVGVDSGAGLASGSDGSGRPVKYMTMPKSMLHSRPSLPIMSTTTTTSASVTQQYQQQHGFQHRQEGYNPAFSTTASRGYNGHAWKPQPFVDWFRPLETSTSRGDGDGDSFEQEMKIIKGSSRGNDNDRLSSLPPLQPSLLSPMAPPPQSQSLPPTPTKSRSTFLGKPSISGFKKRSAPPALPPPPLPSGPSEWAHSTSTMNGVGVGANAAVSMVSLGHSRSHSASHSIGGGQGQGQTFLGPPSQPPSRPTTPKPGMRLSAMKMGTVRSAFAGVGAKVSARMSINSASTRGSAGAAPRNTVASSMGMRMDDIDGDFMDLRDPFAPPPPSKLASVFRGGDHTGGGGGDFWVSERAMTSLGGGGGAGVGVGVGGYDDDDSVEVRRMSSVSGGKRRMNMNAWGRLPMPSNSLLPGSVPGTSSALVANRKKAHSHHGERRKHKNEKRARKAAVLGETNSSLHGYSAPCSAYNAGEEDADFDVEEALLSQRLLRRLDSVEWD